MDSVVGSGLHYKDKAITPARRPGAGAGPVRVLPSGETAPAAMVS
jgi:hypothetical protein